MIVTRKALPRRTFLRGMGTALALPLLDAMVPASTAIAATAAAARRAVSATLYAHGRASPHVDAARKDLTELSPSLMALGNVRDQCTVIDNLELKNAYPGTHATSNAAFLSAAKSKWTESSDYYLGTTADQVAAKQLGKETRLPSLEMSMDLLTVVGQCDNGFACVYQNNLSWSSPTTPLPSEAHPRIVFERLFGDGGSSADRLAELRRNSSLLDWMKQDIGRLQRKLGPRRSNQGQRLSRYRPRSRTADSEGRKPRPPNRTCPISTGRSACLRSIPTTRA